ncbi:hypothetical protein B0T26DRAFT_285770 [Lasiosphaeria miniovina]|uniref:Uncharacterized protein n=1 Tax=Lasiosphaeria miniovina TaxID=1954250 RepID=A0AA40DXZ9_9PEZI|nr:uncharacterized protein B0T26DRAFT_285770 [Lasiosphaeria miniovina]KAK0717171.1 hypothetical protein B0T26DRAFT_285770 [Lasiosphaeria miniovina]
MAFTCGAATRRRSAVEIMTLNSYFLLIFFSFICSTRSRVPTARPSSLACKIEEGFCKFTAAKVVLAELLASELWGKDSSQDEGARISPFVRARVSVLARPYPCQLCVFSPLRRYKERGPRQMCTASTAVSTAGRPVVCTKYVLTKYLQSHTLLSVSPPTYLSCACRMRCGGARNKSG